jgi:hypothetical protein
MKQHGNPEYIFKGYDYTELAEYFGVDDCEEVSVKAINENLEKIRCEIGGLSFNAHPDMNKLREFVSAIEKQDDTYKKPIWRGLSKVIEDGTFVKLLKLLYLEAWT